MLKLPNILTILRIICLPWVGYAVLNQEEGIALAVFLFAAATDAFDGWIARKYNMETNFGKLMDPAADKILLSFVLIFLSYEPTRHLNPWLGSLLLAREFFVSSLRSLLASSGLVMGAAMIGKVKTVFQFVGLSFAIYDPNATLLGYSFLDIGSFCLWISVILSYWGLVHYTIQGYKYISN